MTIKVSLEQKSTHKKLNKISKNEQKITKKVLRGLNTPFVNK